MKQNETPSNTQLACDVQAYVNAHKALNSEVLKKFGEGNATKEEVLRFSEEFFHLARMYPQFVAHLLAETPNDTAAKHLGVVLTSELGDGNPALRHEALYRKYMRSIGLKPEEVMKKPISPITKKLLKEMQTVYESKDSLEGTGAAVAMEHYGTPLCHQLVPALKHYKEKYFPSMDMTYFTLHYTLEQEHADTMTQMLEELPTYTPSEQKSFKRGMERLMNINARFLEAVLS